MRARSGEENKKKQNGTKQCKRVSASTPNVMFSCINADPFAGWRMCERLTEQAPKSLGGHRERLCPGCELRSHYFDPRSDDTCSFVKLCVENAWELNATARTVIPSWHTRRDPLQALTHTHAHTHSRTHVPSLCTPSHCGTATPPPHAIKFVQTPLCCSFYISQANVRQNDINSFSLLKRQHYAKRGFFSPCI